jgi:hypothetical protein
MTTRIDRRFAALKEEGRAALMTFVMGGDPDYETSLAIVKALPPAGADSSMVPERISTMRCTIESPSPLPPVALPATR